MLGRGIKLFTLLSSVVIALAVAASSTIIVHGQQLRSTAYTKQIIKRLETNTDRFSNSVDTALDRSRLDGSTLEDQVNALVEEFEFASDRLKKRADDDIVLQSDLREVLRRGMHLDTFMKTHELSSVAKRDWRRVKSNLDQLARAYGIAWVWAPSDNPAIIRASNRNVIRRLEDASSEFRKSFDEALDRSLIDGSAYEDFMNNVVATFDRSVDKLEDQANDSEDLHLEDLKTALNNAVAIDEFLQRHSVNTRARRDWARVKANLNDLAFLNRVAWNWTDRRASAPVASTSPQSAQGERVSLTRMTTPSASAVAREVRRELLSDLPYYSVFDWIEFEVLPDNTVVLRGEVITPPDKKSRAEDVVEDVAGVTRVVNEIRVLPVSPNDDRLRRALYRAIYNFNSPLFRYGVGSRQAIHIIVENGRATLKGVVDSEGDKNLAYVRARGVSGLFDVRNELAVDGRRPEAY